MKKSKIDKKGVNSAETHFSHHITETYRCSISLYYRDGGFLKGIQ